MSDGMSRAEREELRGGEIIGTVGGKPATRQELDRAIASKSLSGHLVDLEYIAPLVEAWDGVAELDASQLWRQLSADGLRQAGDVLVAIAEHGVECRPSRRRRPPRPFQAGNENHSLTFTLGEVQIMFARPELAEHYWAANLHPDYVKVEITPERIRDAAQVLVSAAERFVPHLRRSGDWLLEIVEAPIPLAELEEGKR